MKTSPERKLPIYVPGAAVFPCECDLCSKRIESRDDDMLWHGIGNCVDEDFYNLKEN